MHDAGDDATHVRRGSDATSEAWERTVEDMRALAEQRRDADWEVVAVPAVHTDAIGRDHGQDDRFGLVHVIPDNHADAVAEAFERATFARFEAYRNVVGSDVFLVTEFLDPETGVALLVAASYDRRRAGAMVQTAREEGVLFSHAKTLDGTALGSVRHEEWTPLVPEDAVTRPGAGGD